MSGWFDDCGRVRSAGAEPPLGARRTARPAPTGPRSKGRPPGPGQSPRRMGRVGAAGAANPYAPSKLGRTPEPPVRSRPRTRPASHAIVSATSTGNPPCPREFDRRPASRTNNGTAAVIFVSINLGATAFTVTPCSPQHPRSERPYEPHDPRLTGRVVGLSDVPGDPGDRRGGHDLPPMPHHPVPQQHIRRPSNACCAAA